MILAGICLQKLNCFYEIKLFSWNKTTVVVVKLCFIKNNSMTGTGWTGWLGYRIIEFYTIKCLLYYFFSLWLEAWLPFNSVIVYFSIDNKFSFYRPNLIDRYKIIIKWIPFRIIVPYFKCWKFCLVSSPIYNPTIQIESLFQREPLKSCSAAG